MIPVLSDKQKMALRRIGLTFEQRELLLEQQLFSSTYCLSPNDALERVKLCEEIESLRIGREVLCLLEEFQEKIVPARIDTWNKEAQRDIEEFIHAILCCLGGARRKHRVESAA
jgi:hypothetical protein